MKVQELIKAVNECEFYSFGLLEDGIENLPQTVAEGLDLDEHRWYSIATNIYKCEDGFVGISGAYQSFSEMQSWEDIGITCAASEYGSKCNL